MDSDDDDIPPFVKPKLKKVTFSPSADSADSADSAVTDKKPLVLKPPKVTTKRSRGDLFQYMREQEAERRYFFDTTRRLAKERSAGDTIPLLVPPWKWSENALNFRI